MKLESLLTAIQEAATDPEAWTTVQAETERYFGAAGSQLAWADHADGNRFGSRTSRCPEIDAHLRLLAPCSEPVRFAARHPQWRRFVDYDYIDETGIARSTFYRECARFDIGYRLALRLVDEPHMSRAMLWFWTPKQGHPDRSHLEKLDLIEGHLRFAAHVSDRLAASLSAERGLVDGLDGAATAAILLDRELRVLHANRRAQAILSAGDGLGVARGGWLAVRGRMAEQAVRGAAAQAARANADRCRRPPGGTALVPRPSGLPPYTVTLAALPAKRDFLGCRRPLILALLRDPVSAAGPLRETLTTAFHLTPAEAEVAARFADGAPLARIAEGRGVALETVRRQLKCVMAKTGVGRQPELMQLLAGLRA
jgi:DNA-binding CsgD family transcriptional regulator